MKHTPGRILLLSLAALAVCSFFLLRTQEVKGAVRVQLSDDLVAPQSLPGHGRLYCAPTQVTGSWLIAEGIEVSPNTFARFSDGVCRDIVLSSADPFHDLRDELTIYGDNRFVLEGNLSLSEAGDITMYVESWEIVYPVKTTLRLPFFWGELYSFDYQ